MSELCDLTATELGARLRAGEVSSVEILDACLARTDEIDVVAGLTRGAVDYVAKPFRLAELLARVRSHLRMARAAAESEDAWQRFYKPSAACADPATSASVECVNAFIRAKREFAARYPNASLPQ